ncbi:MAG: hypothetical protein P4L72_02620 [Parvibaculum sp.]|uniref:hypothetical protein n=1 Tax=Parvibaculum sp. TaxID=2024848 RepID=UPI002843A7F7|nr:hypothetical protein [Parvibaculum sp.]MDR3498103.1 hypothetical protein [Parvibaculum sp.]
MHEATRNLILVHHPAAQGRRDFEEIGEKIRALAPEIEVAVVPIAGGEGANLPSGFWNRPTLTVSFLQLEDFRPVRGLIYMGRRIAKMEQLRKFSRAGIAVPPTVDYQFGRSLAPSFWGEHVVVKPTAPGSMSNGRFTYLLRTESVAQLAPRLFPADHPIRKSPILVQKFIDTGEYPESYRVLTLFGEPLYCMTFRQQRPRAPLSASDEELLAAPIASNAGDDYLHELVEDTEVLDFARRAAAAMPAIPLQGLDIIREAGTGKLFVLENNSGGNTWHFSSQISQTGLQRIPREQRIAQFGAWDIAAKVLAERTLREAR